MEACPFGGLPSSTTIGWVDEGNGDSYQGTSGGTRLNSGGPGEKSRCDPTDHTLHGEGEVQPFPQAGLQGSPGAWQAHRGGLLLRGRGNKIAYLTTMWRWCMRARRFIESPERITMKFVALPGHW